MSVPLTADLLTAAFSAAGVTGDNVNIVIPLAVAVAEQVAAAGITADQFAAFASRAIQGQIAAAITLKNQLVAQQASLAAQISATGV